MSWLRNRLHDDSGIAMISVVLFGVLITAMAAALVAVTIDNLHGANRDRRAASAMGAAEAGLNDGMSFISSSGVGLICSTCTSVWNVNNPVKMTYGDGTQATVYIQAVSPYSPPTVPVGQYRIHSVGLSADKVGVRTLDQTVNVKPLSFPLGVYTAAKINLGGAVTFREESFFSGQCVDSRNKMTIVAGDDGSLIDPYNNIPAAVRSASYITTTNLQNCNSSPATAGSSDSGTIHYQSNYCNSTYPYDQDSIGGPFPAGSTCASQTSGYPTTYANGSNFTSDTMVNQYGFQPRGLTDDEYAGLKRKAQAAGNYYYGSAANNIDWTKFTGSTDPSNAAYNAVLYIDHPQNSFTINNQLAAYAWQTDSSCTLAHPSVIVVVDHGDLNVGSNAAFTGFLFAPDGLVKFAGGASLVGTIFAQNLTFTGGGSTAGNIGLNNCLAKNTPGGILNVAKVHYSEDDEG
jgi:hypothetical protein